MIEISREMLASYLEDALSTSETAKVEQALRQSDSLRQLLRRLLMEQDRGEHSIGAIWRRTRLTCPSREHLGSYLLGALDPDYQDYLDFHLTVIHCPFCQANLEDLKSLHQEPEQNIRKRRQRFFQSSAGLLRPDR